MTRETFLSYIRASDARSDTNFDLYRVETAALKRLAAKDDVAFLAVGLKGIGKSACFRSLCSGGADVVQQVSTETQEPQEIAASRTTLQYMQEIKSELVFQALITLVKRVELEAELAAKIPQDAQQNARVLVNDFLGKLKDAFGDLRGVTVLGCGISFRPKGKKAGGRLKLVPREDRDRAIKVLERAASSLSFRLVIDDPETIFSADREINENLVAALVIAANELQVRIPNFKCVILIKPNVLRALGYVDEFANLPTNSRVKLSWTDDELKEVIRARASAAQVKLSEIFRADPEPALDLIVRDSRSGPRDALRRLELHFDSYPGTPVTPKNLELTIGAYSDACFDQMFAAYERQYPGLARSSLILFEGRETNNSKNGLRIRLDQMVASSTEFFAFKDQPWARDAAQFADLLVQFGLVAINARDGVILPFHASYIEEAAKSDATLTFLPGLRGRIQFSAAPTTDGPPRKRSK